MKTISLFIFLQLLILSFSLQIQFVGPVGPILQKLMPKNISIPASSIIEQDEFHLIMEYKVSMLASNLVRWCFVIILSTTGTLVFDYHSGCHRYISILLSLWVTQIHCHWCFVIILGATGMLVFCYHAECYRYFSVLLSY